MVTHNLTFFDKVDHIIVMDDGKIKAQGGFDDVQGEIEKLG